MDRVVYKARFIGVVIFIVVGIFGYATFVDRVDEELLNPSKSGNILEADYGSSILI